MRGPRVSALLSVAPVRNATSLGTRTYRPSLSLGAGAAVLCASLLINLLAIGAPLTALLIYDRVLLNESRSTLAILAAGAFGIIVIEAVLRLIRAVIISRASAHSDFVARNDVIERVMRRPVRPGQRLALSELNGRLAAVGVLRELRFARLTAIVDLPFGFAFLLLVGFIGGWVVALPAGVCLVVLAALAAVALSNERALGDLQRDDRGRWAFSDAVTRSLHGVAAIASQVLVIDRFLHWQLARSSRQMRQGFLDLLSRDVLTTFSQVLIGAVVVAGALTVLRGGDLSLGGLAACTLLAGRALEPLQGCVQLLHLRGRARLARGDLDSLDASVPAARATAALPEWTGPPEIRFDDVEIGGTGRGGPLITADEIRIPAGEIVAVAGDRGSGKTTLGLALLGMVPVAGTLRVGDLDVSKAGAEAIRHRTGYLPRMPQLPAGRLLDVLTDGDETLYADVRYLAHLTGLDEVIKRLPAGYDTTLRVDAPGELSTGIRQQIAICRILAKKHKLIVADDATCVLDAVAELRFANVIKMLGGETTVVLMTDRPSLRGIAQRRYDLAGGRLVRLPNVIGGRA